MKRYYIFFFLLIFSPVASEAQLAFFKPGWAADSMKHAVDQLYNYQFAKATQTIAPVRRIDPGNPAIQIFDCLQIYWKFFPVSTHPAEYLKYISSLHKALDYTNKLVKKDETNAENSFYALLLNIMIAKQMFEDGDRWKATQHAMDAFAFIKKGFVWQEKYQEYYLTTGLYKYYREFFPLMNPVYKPLMSVFPPGNIQEGLYFLERATVYSVFVKAEAMMYSSYINLRYQNDKKQGLHFASMMNSQYPENYLFKVLYIENLIQSADYEHARVELNKLITSPISFYKLPAALFRGMLEEKYAHDTDEALKWYLNVISLGVPVTKANTNYVGLAHYQIANIYKQKGNTVKAKEHFKKAEDYCQYVVVKKDAKIQSEKQKGK